MSSLIAFNPYDWHWTVGGDETRWWSSAVGAYVDQLPEGAGVTPMADELELIAVLAAYGLPGPVTVNQQIVDAPPDLFGGPTLREVFNVHE